MDATVIEKFWNYAEQGEKSWACWNWKGFTDKNSLPIIRVGTASRGIQEYSARRLSLQLAGTVLLPRSPVSVTCSNPLCVNPDHLIHGSQSRFWAKVQKMSEESGGCWVWTAGQDKDMYGKFKVNGKDVRSHHYSFELFVGHTLPEGIQVCLTCDHPYCVNPAHLFIGTYQDNMADKCQKQRQARGETQHLSKLTEAKVKELRHLRSQGQSVIQLAKEFGVSAHAVSSATLGKTWKHVT